MTCYTSRIIAEEVNVSPFMILCEDIVGKSLEELNHQDVLDLFQSSNGSTSQFQSSPNKFLWIYCFFKFPVVSMAFEESQGHEMTSSKTLDKANVMSFDTVFVDAFNAAFSRKETVNELDQQIIERMLMNRVSSFARDGVKIKKSMKWIERVFLDSEIRDHKAERHSDRLYLRRKFTVEVLEPIRCIFEQFFGLAMFYDRYDSISYYNIISTVDFLITGCNRIGNVIPVIFFQVNENATVDTEFIRAQEVYYELINILLVSRCRTGVITDFKKTFFIQLDMKALSRFKTPSKALANKKCIPIYVKACDSKEEFLNLKTILFTLIYQEVLADMSERPLKGFLTKRTSFYRTLRLKEPDVRGTVTTKVDRGIQEIDECERQHKLVVNFRSRFTRAYERHLEAEAAKRINKENFFQYYNPLIPKTLQEPVGGSKAQYNLINGIHHPVPKSKSSALNIAQICGNQEELDLQSLGTQFPNAGRPGYVYPRLINRNQNTHGNIRKDVVPASFQHKFPITKEVQIQHDYGPEVTRDRSDEFECVEAPLDEEYTNIADTLDLDKLFQGLISGQAQNVTNSNHAPQEIGVNLESIHAQLIQGDERSSNGAFYDISIFDTFLNAIDLIYNDRSLEGLPMPLIGDASNDQIIYTERILTGAESSLDAETYFDQFINDLDNPEFLELQELSEHDYEDALQTATNSLGHHCQRYKIPEEGKEMTMNEFLGLAEDTIEL